MSQTQATTTANVHVEALLTLIGQGDRAAFEVLYRSTAAKLLGVCLSVLRDRAEAEDVLQESFIAIWNKASQFDREHAGGMAWLGAIARHRAIDRLRALPVTAMRAPFTTADAAEDPAPSPVAHAERLADRARLDDCIEELDPHRQQLIRTAFYEGATYEELAQHAGSPLGTVKSWIRRALIQLRACLER